MAVCAAGRPFVAMGAPVATQQSLVSGKGRLTLSAVAPGRFGVRIEEGDGNRSAFIQTAPLAIEVVQAGNGNTQILTGSYQTVEWRGDALQCGGTLVTAHGTRFVIKDAFRSLPAPGAFSLTREVRVVSPDPGDTAFNSRFSLSPQTPASMTDTDFFAPGVWYRSNTQVPPSALASRMTDRFYLFREDRLGLPLIMTRNKRTGATLALHHWNGNPATFAGEDGLARITDARLQFGSLGIVNEKARPALTFVFPGTEGERTYIYGGSSKNNQWAYRSHPMRVGVPHRYQLILQLSRTPDFPAAVRRTWRTMFDLQKPPLVSADLSKTYQASLQLLGVYTHPYHGVPGIPFAVRTPSGVVKDASSQMGFVGQALPAAALSLDYGLENNLPDTAQNAAEVVDFWVKNAPTASGVLKTWYDIHPDGTFTWRNYHQFLRVASDGADGVLQAWNVLRKRGRNKPEWLQFCRGYGDWLAKAQAPDGSWAREYDLSGKVVTGATDTTDQAIPFLVDLYKATGDARYKRAALRAGKFCWETVHLPYAYVGGTPDNPNVVDKEAGMMALAAFLALYDIDPNPRWLAAASQAAWFSETWVYWQNIPLPTGDPKNLFPPGRTTYGLSLIATGHSGADNYMAGAPFLFYRLFLWTGETHFRDAALLLLFDTKQMMDWDGSLGYAYPGLLSEALSFPPPRGHGQAVWLPWLTVALAEPMARLKETFGTWDLTQINKIPLKERRKRNARFSRTRGFAPAP